MLFDSHAHLASFPDDKLDGIVKNAISAGVSDVMCTGHEQIMNERTIEICARYHKMLHCALGYDRDCAKAYAGVSRLEIVRAMEGLIAGMLQQAAQKHVRVAAIGEIGLDYHYSPETAEPQKILFQLQVESAVGLGLPVIVHCRDAEQDTLEILSAVSGGGGGRVSCGVIHCFTGSAEFASKVLNMGFYIGISGIVTFRNAENVREIAKYVPEDRLLIETDSPYLSPMPDRGRVNEPARLESVARKVAEIRGIAYEKVAEMTRANAIRLFNCM